MNDARPPATLHDVAREAGVSLATASRVVNGSTRVVAESYRQRVLAAAERLHYSANRSAQAVAKGTSATVALLVADVADPYFSSIASGVVDQADRERLVVTMAATAWDPERELELVRAVRGQRPRVIILAGSRTADAPTLPSLVEELEAVEASGGRVVVIGSADLPFRSVPIDNAGGAAELARSLVALGYRRFGALSAPRGTRTADDRLAGFRAGLAESGIALDDASVAHGAFTRDGGIAAMGELLASGHPAPELVFAANDVMAVGALSAIRAAGLEPGADIAVAGFDDIPTVQDVTPPLTTARLPLAEIGRRALALALAAPGEEANGSTPIEAETVIRASTPGR